MTSAVDFDLERRARYSQGAGIYRILPLAVARPTSHLELRQVMAEALANGWPITPRGAGTAMSGCNVGEGIVVDLTRWEPSRCMIDASNQVVRCAPALTLAALQKAASHVGLRFPPNPSSQQWATMGGMISTNAAGARSFRYGSVREWILGLTIEAFDGPLILRRGIPPDPSHPVVARFNRDVLPRLETLRAEILWRYPAVRKNSTGYGLNHFLLSGDLLDLVVGAEGTLGIVTDLTCRLDPIPRHRIAVRMMVASRAALVPVIAALQREGASSIEFLDRTFLRLIDASLAGSGASLLRRAAGVLLAELEGEDLAALTEATARVAVAENTSLLHSEIANTEADIEALWQIRHGASPALARLQDGRRSLQVIEDGVVPVAVLPRYLDFLDECCQVAGVAVVLFGHAGDGHVHANLLPDLNDPEWEDRVQQIYQQVSEQQRQLGGAPSGEHGAGRLRGGLLQHVYGAEVTSLFDAVRAAFDPTGLFNRGVNWSSASGALSHLKVGAGAMMLPPTVASWLDDIEANARWGVPRW